MNKSEYKILIVDDEEDILEFMEYNLSKEGYQVIKAQNGKEAVLMAEKENPNLILLDVMMPVMDGIEACAEIRKNSKLNRTLIAFLTARNEDYSQIAGFEAGGDDYINKPIKLKVLSSRIVALLKRYNKQSNISSIIEGNSSIKIDRDKYIVYNHDEKLTLPRKEFELLALLASVPDKVFTRDEIYDEVWGQDIIVGDRTIDVHIRKLREKLGDEYIKTIKGVGYKFIDAK